MDEGDGRNKIKAVDSNVENQRTTFITHDKML